MARHELVDKDARMQNNAQEQCRIFFFVFQTKKEVKEYQPHHPIVDDLFYCGFVTILFTLWRMFQDFACETCSSRSRNIKRENETSDLVF
ncbi:CLUMA_CG005578, isoform A [Clunio marinus]|uniref:CLUMA_CG005578, isoform A n=1 Tax=Clunio marinus TaxID=568069 RepID=A0A1J1HZM9_9DIPT|nr:CLUMA_CG005578, isoform A [Clunio marinus]